MRRITFFPLLLSATLLSGCDMLGGDTAEKLAAAKEAEGKAIGGACRHAGRAIEDCYALNKKSDKASVFAGWRDMNDYMRENKIEPVPPQAVAARAEARAAEARATDSRAEAKTEAKATPEMPVDGAAATEKRPTRSSSGKLREPRAQDS